MASTRQKQAARRNIKKAAAAAATRKKTITKLPKRVRTALGKQGNKVKRKRAQAASRKA